MGIISGFGGAVSGKSTVRNWSISSEADLKSYIASNTAKGTGRIDGNKDWSGSYDAYGHTPDTVSGADFTFTGSLDAINGATGPAICDSVDVEINIEEAEIISHTVNFSGDGALTLGAAVATDSTDPGVFSGADIADVSLGTLVATPIWTALTQVRSVALHTESDNKSYNHVGTSKNTLRSKGPFDCSATVNLYTDNLSTLPAKGTVHKLRVAVNTGTPSDYWLFDFVRVASISSGAEIEGSDLVEATIVFEFSAYEDVDATRTQGVVTDPGETDVWPYA